LAVAQFALSLVLLLIAGRSLPITRSSGEKLVESTPHQYRQPEAALVTKTPGPYHLNVTSLEPAPLSRHYELRIGHATPAQPADPNDSKALATFTEAEQLLSEWNQDSLRKAIKLFMEARLMWRDIRPDRATDALRSAAGVHFILGEYREALTLNTEAVAESNRHGDRLRAMAALSAVGQAYSALGQSDRARKELERVLVFADRNAPAYGSTEERHLAAEVRNYLGEVYYTQGISIRALTYFKRALELFTELGDRRGQAEARLNLGYASSALGAQQEALVQFNQARELFRAVNDPRGAALSLTAIGSVYSLQGNEQAALDSHGLAMTTLRTVGDRHGEGVTLNGVGQAYEDLGEKQAALDNYVQSLVHFEKTESVGFASVSEYKIANIHRLLGNFDQAFIHYDRSIQLSRAVGKLRIEAYALRDIAVIYSSQRKRSQTFSQYQKILHLYRKLGDFRGQAITLNSVGDLHFAFGENDPALVHYKRALPLIRSAGDREGEISTLFAIARTARDANRLEEALSYVEQSIKIIEALRIYVASPELRTSYFAAVHENYDLYIQILMRLDQQKPGNGFASLALQASESGRARALIEVLSEAGADLRQGMDPQQVQQLHDLQESLAAKERIEMALSNSPETQAEAAEVAREIRQLTTEEQTLQARIRQQNPRYAALAQPKRCCSNTLSATTRVTCGPSRRIRLTALNCRRERRWKVRRARFTTCLPVVSISAKGRITIPRSRAPILLMRRRPWPCGECCWDRWNRCWEKSDC
jgi:tetratricopeptide (TPR) repeat protein